MRPVRAGTILTLLGLGLAACGGHEKPKADGPAAAGPARDVKTAEVARTGGAGEVAVPAAVQARERAALSARMPASVTELPYQEGQWVKAGAVVVRLDDGALRASVAAAEAGVKAAESDLARTKALLEKGAATPRELEQMTAAASGAQAQLTAAKDNLSYTALRAPFAGRVASRRVNLGDVVNPGMPLIEIEGEGGLEIRATVESGIAATLRPGSKVKAIVDGQPAPLAATVNAVAPSGDATTHRFELKADLPGAPGLRAGLFARLLVPGLAAESPHHRPRGRALRAGRAHRPLRRLLENIRARAHFLVALTPSALERCADPGDWLRREIEEAIECRRNIVPLLLEGFDFGASWVASQLTGRLAELKKYNGLTLPVEYFDAAMGRLREKFLNVPVNTVLHRASTIAREAAKGQQAAAALVIMESEKPKNGSEPVATPIQPIPELGGKPGEELPPRLLKKITNSIGMEFVLIPAGSFVMGSRISLKELVQRYGGEEKLYKDEKPHHPVKIEQPFYLQATPVTQGQWQRLTGDNPSNFKDCGDDCPVEQVSWIDVQRFIEELNLIEHTKDYRLPSEAEWEYACRAGSETEFFFGSFAKRLGEFAWYSENSDAKTHPVGKKKPNGWGLYDMHGNVWEWVEDEWHDSYDGAPVDGRAWIDNPRGSYRVKRGGGWNLGAQFCRSAMRGVLRPDDRNGDVGFRLSRSVGLGT